MPVYQDTTKERPHVTVDRATIGDLQMALHGPVVSASEQTYRSARPRRRENEEVPPMRASVRGNTDENQGQRSNPRITLAACHRASEMLNILNYVMTALLFACVLMLIWILMF